MAHLRDAGWIDNEGGGRRDAVPLFFPSTTSPVYLDAPESRGKPMLFTPVVNALRVRSEISIRSTWMAAPGCETTVERNSSGKGR
jgi:hypothetical protein